LINSLPSNPLPASLEINLRDPSDYLDVANYLRAQTSSVDSVQDLKVTVGQMIAVANVLRTGGIVVLVVVCLTVLFIIMNTIRLAVMARAEEIEIMRLVAPRMPSSAGRSSSRERSWDCSARSSPSPCCGSSRRL